MVRTLKRLIWLLSAVGLVRFDKNTNTIPVCGSAQAQVPVKPWWPKLDLLARSDAGPPSPAFFSGLSKP